MELFLKRSRRHGNTVALLLPLYLSSSDCLLKWSRRPSPSVSWDGAALFVFRVLLFDVRLWRRRRAPDYTFPLEVFLLKSCFMWNWNQVDWPPSRIQRNVKLSTTAIRSLTHAGAQCNQNLTLCTNVWIKTNWQEQILQKVQRQQLLWSAVDQMTTDKPPNLASVSQSAFPCICARIN